MNPFELAGAYSSGSTSFVGSLEEPDMIQFNMYVGW
jgi:hypothetical protein